MSRAFLSESESQFDEDDVPEAKIPLPQGSKNYMTPEGAERIRGELASLVNEERPKTAAAVARLLAPGSGPDREELSIQRRRLREIDRRIEYLTRMISRIEVVNPSEQEEDRVLFGATVTVKEQGSGEAKYHIVGIDEASPAEGRISWVSPLARAMLGARAGAIINLKLPEGESRLEIIKIEYRR